MFQKYQKLYYKFPFYERLILNDGIINSFYDFILG